MSAPASSLYTSDQNRRPPFVRFEEREWGVNDDKTKEVGHTVYNVVNFALITPHGSKDVIEKVAEEWLKDIRRRALNGGDYRIEWVNFFDAQYAEWLKGNELPREGTPVRTWQLINREQQRRLCAIGYTAVEDLAQIPDSGLAEIGLDGRNLRDLARAWLQEGKDKGVNAKALADALAMVARLEERLEQRDDEVRQLGARLEALEGTKRGKGRQAPGDT